MNKLIPYAGYDARSVARLDAIATDAKTPLDQRIIALWRTGRFDTMDIAGRLGISEAVAYAGIHRRSGQVTSC